MRGKRVRVCIGCMEPADKLGKLSLKLRRHAKSVSDKSCRGMIKRFSTIESARSFFLMLLGKYAFSKRATGREGKDLFAIFSGPEFGEKFGRIRNNARGK